MVVVVKQLVKHRICLEVGMDVVELLEWGKLMFQGFYLDVSLNFKGLMLGMPSYEFPVDNMTNMLSTFTQST